MKEKERNIKDVFKYWIFKYARQFGEYGFPLIEKSEAIPANLIPFNAASSFARRRNVNLKDYYIHFFIDDYQFERVWNNPKAYVDLFSKFGGIIMPDYSVYRNFPKALQVFNVFKSRLMAFYYQSEGIDVIPNITWSDETSFEWVLDGLPKNSVVALSSNGCLNSLVVDEFVRLFEIAMERLEPIKIIFVGKKPTKLNDNRIIEFPGHLQRMKGMI